MRLERQITPLRRIAPWLVLASLLPAALLNAPAAWGGDPAKLAFWGQQRKGANCQNTRVTPAYWAAAREAGIEFIRLVPDGWRADRRDFLMGNADAFDSLDVADLQSLRHVLNHAQSAGVHVILTMFSLPGARWKQNNGDKDDSRLWTQPGFREQAFSFWRQLATALRDHPAVVAYNPLNEPHPERAFGLDDPHDAKFAAWRQGIRGTPADLDEFNRGMVVAIRAVDPRTPILLDGWFYADPVGLTVLEPVDDAAILYAFHVYEPWDYTTFRVNRGRFTYPTKMPEGWTPDIPARQVGQVAEWAEAHHIPPSRIIASEFGVDRRVAGAQLYLTDWIALLNARNWHWAFYAFREDGSWGGLDYELGTAPLGGDFWKAVERGEDPERHKHRGPNPLWQVLAREFEPKSR
jgi:hypothetical protein